jgi:hypothetical protein
MGSFSEDSSEKNKFYIGIWAGVYLTTPSLLPPALNACYAGYLKPRYNIYNRQKGEEGGGSKRNLENVFVK